VTLAAHLKLCETYTPAWQNTPNLLSACLDDLVASSGGEPVPPDPLAVPPGEPGSPGLVAEWAATRRAELPPDEGAAAGVVFGGAARELTGDRLWSYGFEPGSVAPRFVEFEDPTSPALYPFLYLQGTDDALECLDTGGTDDPESKPRLAWRTEMRLPGDFDHDRQTVRELQRSRHAATDGQIGVFNASDGIFGIGLVTGRRLWATAYDTPLDLELVPYRDSLIAAADGYVAAMPRAGRLTLMRIVDGSTVWERDLRGEPVTYLWLEDGRVLAADASLQRVTILDRADGRLIAQVLFRQPNPEAGLVQLVRVGGVICGPDATTQSDGIMAISLETGQPAWRADLGKPVGQLFVPDPGRVGVGLFGGDVRILDPKTGETILERRFSKGLPIIDAKLIDGTLIGQAERRHGQIRDPELVAIDIATGEEVWAREDLAGLQEPPGPLAILGGSIAALVDSNEPAVPGARQPRNFIGLAMIDIKTGQSAGTVAELSSASTGIRVNRDLLVRPGVVVVGSSRTVQAFRVVPTGVDGGGS
jgi:hypothetical protein